MRHVGVFKTCFKIIILTVIKTWTSCCKNTSYEKSKNNSKTILSRIRNKYRRNRNNC